MARSNGDNGADAVKQTSDTQTFKADGADRIDLPSPSFISEATLTREGGDLVLQTPDGQSVVIEGYFNADPAPVLHAPDGAILTPNLVDSFVRSPLQYAAGETASDESPVGAVEEVKGDATVTRADGSVETITNGTPIYQGDIIETAADGAVNIVFLDETSMAVSANARLAIDEYTFDPATESGTTNFSVLRGLFVFTSGLIGRDDPDDVKIETPVGSIGIRGTIIAGEINPGGESKISVLEGAIVVKNAMGEVTLSEQFETVSLSGYDQPMQNIGVVPASDINTRFNSIGDVNPSLFSVIGQSAQEQSVPTQTPEAPKVDAAPEQPSSPSSQSPTQEQPAQASTSTSTPSAPTSEPVAAPVPEPAPNVFTSVTDAPVSLSPTSSSGLPDTTVVTGQPSGGLAGADNTTTPTTSVSATSPTTVSNTPTTNTATQSTPPTGTASQEPQAPPPSVLDSRADSGPTGPSLSFSGGTLTDIAASNALVGTVAVSSGNVTGYSFADSGGNISTNGYYQIAPDGIGGFNITLTTSGAAALAGSLDTVQLGSFQIEIELDDGTILSRAVGVTVTDANGATRLDLDTGAAGVAILSDSYTDGSGNSNGFGYTISALGDRNGDGFDDFIVSNSSNLPGQNHLYQFMGRSSLYTTNDITSGAVAPMILSVAGTVGDSGSTVIHGVGDFNGDGVIDYVVGQPYSNVGATPSGNAFIINGADMMQYLGFPAGPSAGAEIGYSVSSMADFNNDGYADVLIGAPGTDRVYLSRGYDPGTWAGNISASLFTDGPGGSDFGRSITGIGDFNGDGFSDFAVGAPSSGGNAGTVFIYSGNVNGLPGTPTSSITGMAGEFLGTEVSAIGDINGDGLTDLMVAGQDNVSLVFGTDSAATRNISFATGGYSVLGGGGVGDFNGDGYDDFVITLGDSGGSKSYVVFGRDFPTNATYDLNFLKDSANALELNYSGVNNTGTVNVSAIGDINADGYEDFAIGLPDANGAADGDGGLAIVYGRNTGAVSSGVTTATTNDQSLVGTTGDDTFNDGAMTGVSMRGGAGLDLFRITNTDFLNIDGGAGHDVLAMNGFGNALDFSNVNFERISRVEALKFGDNNQTMTLTLENLFNLMKSSDSGELYLGRLSTATSGLQLVLNDSDGGDDYAGADNSVADITAMLDDYSTGTVTTGTRNVGVDTYNTFTIGGYTLLIDQAITVDAQ